jgi:Type II secretion system (T2SS), protein G
MRMTALALTLAAAALAAESVELRHTKANLRTLAKAAEAYFGNHGEYPQAKTLEELKATLAPKDVPMTDGWGTPFAYRSSRGRSGHYRFVSAGPDRKFDPTSLDLGKRPSKSDDIIYADVELIRP